ncbi:hypothetical protein ISN45_Aa04g027690 [Arabidopsis thaliana x Arabidopsis arenosa]|uniref:Uncharacterized protein n=1 Tax=Arabidopsis thaliana x Arabidopsis arenosa TaxID=1240361 RepID=A0A8T2ADP3_9BRAS|nr:hypothetical protein ISN45_Aa04g027690 [Arabidopsis thaliana x Arabidopsis arenosa]
MKASMKFREEQKPILKAKIPLSILGLPLQSGIVAGESKELSLNLSTSFESGPSLKIAYRPNDTWNPFSLIVKTGTGSFGSPISSSMIMSAEFNFVGKGNPSFMLHFKPRFGDFSIKKSHSSSSAFKSMNGSVSEEDSSIEVVDVPVVNGYAGAFKRVTVLPSACAGDIAGLISGVDCSARTCLPLRGRAVVNFRWGIRVPTEIKHDFNPTAVISLRRIPFLVMNKIGIVHVDGSNVEQTKSVNKPRQVSGSNSADVAEACLAVRRQMEELRTENSQLKRSVEDLRQEITNVRPFSPAPMDFGSSSRYHEDEKINGGKSKADKKNNERKTTGYGGKNNTTAEELKKA